MVLAAADEFPHIVQDPVELSEAARWFLELAEENRRQGRGSLAGVAVSRAAIALSIGAGDPGEARDLISAARPPARSPSAKPPGTSALPPPSSATPSQHYS